MQLLIVEDAKPLRDALMTALSASFARVEACSRVDEARALLGTFRPDVALVDVDLPDGSALDIMRIAAESTPAPSFVVMSGVARPDEAFALAQLGARSYLTKPVTLERVEHALRLAESSPPDVVPHVRAAVGRIPLRSLESTVRVTMITEAMAKADGSRRGAARLLSVSRQLLQHILRGRG